MEIMRHIERIVYGATAEEAVERTAAKYRRLVDQGVERAFGRMADALDQDEDDTLEDQTPDEE